jgi:hypothetical protein
MKPLKVEHLTPHHSEPNTWVEVRDHNSEDIILGKAPKVYRSHFGRDGQTIEEYVDEFNKALEDDGT